MEQASEREPVSGIATERIVGRQLDRGDCRIGDWVREADLPEWAGGESPRRFRPGSVILSPDAGVIGGIVPAEHPEEWVFEPAEREGQRAWVRLR